MLQEDKDFLELLGYLYLQYGKEDEAKTIYSTLLELEESPPPLLRLTYAYCLAQTGQHAVALHNLAGIDGNTLSSKVKSAILLLRGNILWNLGKRKEARSVLEEFLQAERQRLRTESPRLSLIVESATGALSRELSPPKGESIGSPSEHSTADASKEEKNFGDEGAWKKILRFIARKDIDRELGR